MLPCERGRRNVTDAIDITEHDTLFASRTTAEDWARILTFRSRPHFLDGVRRHAGVMAPFFAHNLILNKVVAEVWRFQMLVVMLYLDATRDAQDPRTGLTLANMQKHCAQLELASPGRIYAFLNIMKLGGYIRSERSSLDSRVVHMMPTAQFMETVEEWNANIFESIDAAHPQAGLVAKSAQHPALGLGMRTSGAEGLIAGWKPLDPFPEANLFAGVDGGWLLMEHIVAAALQEPGGVRITPVTLNMSAVGKQFGGSRSNLRRLLESAYELGLLDAPPEGGRNVIFSSLMVCSFITFIASFLSYFEDHSAIALGRIEGVG
jgi:hypothetical protein